MALTTPIFTGTLTNSDSPFVITSGMGVSNLSILNLSAVTATVLGTRRLGSKDSSALSIEQNVTFNFTTIGYVMDQLTITIPASCTLQITAS